MALRPGVSVGGGDGLVIEGAGVRLTLGRTGGGMRAAIGRLAGGGEDHDRLGTLVLDRDGPDGLAGLHYLLRRLAQRGLLTWSVTAEGRPLATLVPTSPWFAYPDRRVAPAVQHVLSRFAYLRRDDGALVLESPRAHARVVLHDARAAAVVHALAVPVAAEEIARGEDAAPLLLALLVNAGVAEPAGEEDEPPLRTWEFHDLLFHARSRSGRHDQPVGATFRFQGSLPSPPALEPAPAGDAVELRRPSLEALERADPPFSRVLGQRRSVRAYGSAPITAGQLGEFLFRSARVTDRRTAYAPSPHGPVEMDVALRPYPGAGALYELEVYAAVNACDGLAPGLYRYDPLDHRLAPRAALTEDVKELLRYAALSIEQPAESLQVLLVLAARFPRIAWKYSAVAYDLVLKDVGVVFQTMYLVATAMGLAPCALGGGDADRFARAAGTDYYGEPSVGEFLLGSAVPST